jgi:hypothetical protein
LGLLIGLFDRFSPRPHIFTYLFLAVLVYLLFSYKYINREKYIKHLYFIPLITLIWGNLHLGVITGILLLLIFLLSEFIVFRYPAKFSDKKIAVIPERHLKKLGLITLLSAASLIINPYGIRTYIYAYNHTQMKMLEQIAEWLSPFTGKVETTFVITVYKVFLFAGFLILLYSYKKKDLTFSILCIFFAVYSLRAIRFIVDYEIIIIPLLALSINYFLISRQQGSPKNFASKLLNGIPVKIALILLLAYLTVRFQSDEFYISLEYNREAGLGISNRYFPKELYEFIRKTNIKGKPFNNFDTGGYFHWEFPEEKIFIDSRNINDEIFNEYFSILKNAAGF